LTGLKQKAISGAKWTFAGRLFQQGSQLVLGIILARLLLPYEYGLVGMAMVFIAILTVFIEAGFGSAIVQKKEIHDIDLSTVFFINIGVSVLIYITLYLCSPLISAFFEEKELIRILRVLSLIVLLSAFSVVQNAVLRREMKFKTLTRITIISQLSSGVIAVFLAYYGFGVWALVAKTLLNQTFINIQLWLHEYWLPSWEFSKKSFNELFPFSNKLLVSSMINQTYMEIHKLVVGKFYPASELGFYTKANGFKNILSQSLTGSLTSFLLPVFSKIQDEPQRFKQASIKVIKIVMFFNINAMILLAIIAKPMILGLLGEKWSGAIPYLQLLVFVGLFYPLHAINVQILISLGRSDLFLRIEVFKKIIGIPAVLLAIFLSVKAMVIGMIVTSIISLVINTFYTNKLIGLGLFQQLKSISKSFFIAIILVFLLVPLVYLTKDINQIMLFLIVSVSAILLVYGLSRLLNMEEYTELKSIFINLKSRNGRK